MMHGPINIRFLICVEYFVKEFHLVYTVYYPTPAAALSEARVYCRSSSWIAVSNSSLDMEACLL